jgi:hypothetical protein
METHNTTHTLSFQYNTKFIFGESEHGISLDASTSDWIDGWMDTAKLLLEAWR